MRKSGKKYFANWQSFVDAEILLRWEWANMIDESPLRINDVPPENLRVLQFDDADWEQGLCRRQVLKARIFAGDGFEDAYLREHHYFGERRGNFWRNALIQYCFDVKQNRVLFMAKVGPFMAFKRSTIHTFHPAKPTYIVNSIDIKRDWT